MSTATEAERFTLEDGYVTGKRTSSRGGLDELDIQFRRFVSRLLELALN